MNREGSFRLAYNGRGTLAMAGWCDEWQVVFDLFSSLTYHYNLLYVIMIIKNINTLVNQKTAMNFNLCNIFP